VLLGLAVLAVAALVIGAKLTRGRSAA
jgi:hypothetical protein